MLTLARCMHVSYSYRGARERTFVVIRVKGNVSAVQAQTRDKPTPTLLYRQFLDSVMTGIEGLGECGETDS